MKRTKRNGKPDKVYTAPKNEMYASLRVNQFRHRPHTEASRVAAASARANYNLNIIISQRQCQPCAHTRRHFCKHHTSRLFRSYVNQGGPMLTATAAAPDSGSLLNFQQTFPLQNRRSALLKHFSRLDSCLNFTLTTKQTLDHASLSCKQILKRSHTQYLQMRRETH